VVGLKVPGVVIEDAQAVKKTCPNFYALLRLM
jgi:5-enolpyruvylshikimate-3-phosphate synthase